MTTPSLQAMGTLAIAIFTFGWIALAATTVRQHRVRITRGLASQSIFRFTVDRVPFILIFDGIWIGALFGRTDVLIASLVLFLVLCWIEALRRAALVRAIRGQGYDWFRFVDIAPYWCLVGTETRPVPPRDEVASLPSYRDGDVYSLIEIVLLRRAAKRGESAVDSRGLVGNDRVGSPLGRLAGSENRRQLP